MNRARIEIAKNDIVKLFKSLDMKVLKRSDIEKILAKNREFWRLPVSMTVHKFLQFMLERTDLKKVRFEFPNRAILRYTWGDGPDYELFFSLSPDSYFTHYTAIYLHDLTEQVPKTVYLNSEQPAKHFQRGDLTQGGIDRAFKNRPRMSNNLALYKDQRICILNGMFTDQLGVVDMNTPSGESIRVTDIERTLIDATVRPFYSGGVFEVLKAYKLAKENVSVNRLAARLRTLNYIYPYHQAIGFYLERAGVYNESSIKLFRKFEMNHDFYLTNQMKDTDYSKEWRLHFPKGLQ